MVKVADRRQQLAEYVMRMGYVRIDDLVERFNISRMTVHRHLDRLERQGVLRKLRGAVTVQPSGLYESSFRYRSTIHQAEKLALARAALEYVEPGQAVMLDDSTTTVAVSSLLRKVGPLTVITNSAAVLETLSQAEDIELICLGGQFNHTYNAYLGLLCEHAIAELRVKVLFLSASAIQGATAFHQDQQVIRVKQAMMSVARTRILLVDHHKFGGLALHRLADLSAFDAVLTTEGLAPEHLGALNKPDIKLRIVPLTGEG
ncbi:MAG: DeoR/GlpR transcriptional regulator [Rhodospirillaceae bacterium]|nr:DeoR/GlpR transcriptional regulator [Rhodospirillaceae bacterium]